MLVAFALAVCGGGEAAATGGAAARAAETLEAFMEERRIPGLSAAVGCGGEVRWVGAFGVADLETEEAVTPSSAFPLGSTTKALTSAALGKLVEAGKLDLDAPVQRYVPGFPDKGHRITPRLLAGHLSGLRDYDFEAGEYANTRRFESVEEAMTIFEDDPLDFEPGSDYLYSVYNYVLLSAVIEGASGQEFADFVRSEVLAPLGLERTGPNRQPEAMPGRVTSYGMGFLGFPAKAPFTDLSNKWAAGGYVSTPTEMVRFGLALLDGRLLRPETFEVLTTPLKLADGSETGEGYALGWRSGRRSLQHSGVEARVVHHGGLGIGSTSFFVLLPEHGVAVSLLGNLLFRPPTDFIRKAYEVADLFVASGCPSAKD